MKHAPFRHAVELRLYSGFKRLLLRRSHTQVRRLGRRLGRLGWRSLTVARRRATANVALALPHLDPLARAGVVKRCFEHFGSHFCEVLSAARFDPSEVGERFDVDGREILLELRRRGPLLLTTGHFGSWELALHPLASLLGTLHAVARPPDNQAIGRDLQAIRERFGVRLIEKHGAGPRMLNALRAGGCVAISIDQHVPPRVGIQIPFFGRPAWTSPILAMLSLRLGVPVVPFVCLPVEGGRYRLEVRPPLMPEGQGREAEAEMTRRCLEEVEREVLERPELWLWMHRRWRDGDA